MKLLLAGGDLRARMLAPLLREEGHEVHTIGLETGDEAGWNPAWADVLVFPYPFAVRAGLVPTLTGLSLHPEDVLERAAKDAVVLGGKGLYTPDSFVRVRYGDELDQENAELSAEAAVYEVMQRSDLALSDMRVLMTGYGLFGRALAKRLKLFGAEVWIAARRQEQRLQAANDGMHPLCMDEMPLAAAGADMLLNTVPAPVVEERTLQALGAGKWILELASAPYGFDREMAKAMGLLCDVLPGLPARYAPRSAAHAVKRAILRALSEAAV